jgi:hypothetical protein
MPWREFALSLSLVETVAIYALLLCELYQGLRAKGGQR